MFVAQWKRRETALKFRWGTEGWLEHEKHSITRKQYEGTHALDDSEQLVRAVCASFMHVNLSHAWLVDAQGVLLHPLHLAVLAVVAHAAQFDPRVLGRGHCSLLRK